MNILAKLLFPLVLTVSVFLSEESTAAIPIADLHTDQTKYISAAALTRQSALIVAGVADEKAIKSYHVDGRLYNFVQTVFVSRVFKGKNESVIQLLRPGITPAPSTNNPLPIIYPGPLPNQAEGYVLFLNPTADPAIYSVSGGWQGVYPVYGGKTVTLAGYGFAAMNGLDLDGVGKLVTRLGRVR
ncbi:hypothetical protein ACI7RC_08845 [Brevibacillus sp. B_LB10_24]|uniref:hypothetical protein n=1 Tax=Brevibacillus sp. B_LB10_24 TaxID=3380645 RepID=UPI0038BD37E5